METIFRKLRRSSRKKKKLVEVDTIDERDWAHAKTLDLEEDTSEQNYGKTYKNKIKKNENKNEKRENSLEDYYVMNNELGSEQNRKKEKFYLNSFSRMNEDLTTVSTDFTNEYYIKKKRTEHNKYMNDHEKKKFTYLRGDFGKYQSETKEYLEPYEQLDLYREADIEQLKGRALHGTYEEDEAEDVLSDEAVDEVEDGVADEAADEADEYEYEYMDDQAADDEKESVYTYEDQTKDNNYSKKDDEKSNTQSEHSKESILTDKSETHLANESEENEVYFEEKLDIYSTEEIDNEVEVAYVKGKGRCMFTRKNLEPGSIIFIEKPLFIITPSLNEKLWDYLNKLNNEENFELPLKWHFAALCTITLLNDIDFKACIDKWIPEPDKGADKDVFNVLDKVCEKKITKNGYKYYYYKNKLIEPDIYDRIIQVWHYNAFGHHTDNEGLVLYNRISMLAHSCNSTACWHYGENDSFVLRARVKLNVGDELTISYLGDDDLYKSSNIRREKLTNWLFVCMCSRCTNPVDNSRGFKCSTCGIGTFFIKSEYHDEIPIITKCNICLSEISESTAYEYIEYENSYIERLQQTDKSDLTDALAVYVQAEKIFTQHWIMYQLYTILFEGYRDACQWNKAIYYQMLRIRYAVDVIPRANYVLAWLYEELGEIHANSINADILLTENDFTISYEDKKRICSHFLKSIHLLEILCGYSHDYLKDSLNKYYRIDSLTTTDAPQIEE
ncbi:SET domain protein, putative [Plasmodium malariae]|uniref:SET domain protein, putative n=2 Tax=Plasmodium malariae TaxID=5858 RepID=A0A1C3KCE0_PLAMA|nr:SET domain protein, putative [Plasmodium malariae]